MPNRPFHDALGAAAGLGTGAYRVYDRRQRLQYKSEMPGHDLLQVLGSTVSGLYSSRLPDVIEPSMGNSHHRGTAHSVSVGAAVACTVALVDGLEDGFRDAADEAALHCREAWQEFEAAEGVVALGHLLEAGFYLLLEALAAFLAGVPAGAVAGYVSHVAADAFTPRSVSVV